MCFVVRYLNSSQERLVETFWYRPFTTTFRGQAALHTWRGRWTGFWHFKFSESCDSERSDSSGK